MSLPPDPASTPAASGSADGAGTPADRLRGRLMAKSLGRLLDRAPGAREVLPHLAALERSLLERGSCAIDQVPPHWLGRICSQLSSLPLPDEDPPLQDLLKRLTRNLQGDDEGDDWDAGPAFNPERTMVIREVSHSEFEAAEAEQANTVFTPRL